MNIKKITGGLAILLLFLIFLFAFLPPFGTATAAGHEPDPQSGAEALPPADPVDPPSFSDLDGHWAEAAMLRAWARGLIGGYAGELMKPDQSMNKAEVLTILTRLIGNVPPASLAESDVRAEDWYYDAAAQAAALGLLPPQQLCDMEAPISREDSFILIASAFQLARHAQSAELLRPYYDAALLSADARASVAALLESDYIQGHEGLLKPKATITRAEFISILERMIQPDPSFDAPGSREGGAILLPARDPNAPLPAEANLRLSDLDLHSELFLTAESSSLTLENVRSDARILIRSAALASLNISGGDLSQLTIAATGGDVSISPKKNGQIRTLTVGDGAGELHLGEGIGKVEITGDHRSVFLDMKALDSLTVSGSNNVITVSKSCRIDAVTLLALGSDNELLVQGRAETLTILGDRNTVAGKGKAGDLLLRGLDCRVTLSADMLWADLDYGLSELEFTLTPAQNPLPAGETAAITASFAPLHDAVVSAQWYQDGVPAAAYQNPALPLHAGASSTFYPSIPYSEDMKLTTTIALELRYQRSDQLQSVRQEIELELENHPYSYYHPGPKASDKLVALTFDDGPSGNTGRLLDILASRDVSATFFLVGRSIHSRPELLVRMLDDGHEIGSHSYSHPDLSRASAATIRSELSSTAAAMQEAAGHTPTLLRPPYGAYNQSVLDLCREDGVSVICWSVDTLDWKSRNSKSIYDMIFHNGAASVKDGDIILMHDTVGASVDVIASVIDRLLEEGYHLVTVSELITLRYENGMQAGTVYFHAR